MIVHTVRIPYKYGETIRIRPVFDIHYGNRACDYKALKKFVQGDSECLFVGGGDWADSIIVSDMKRYQKSMDDSDSDDILDEQVQGLYDIFLPVKDRILGCGTGNHENQVSRRYGTHPMKRICKKLGVPYLGYSWFLRLILSENGSRSRTVLIKGMHGFGGGRTLGADLTRYSQDMNYYEADCFMYGHTHQKHWTPIERLGLSGSKIIAKPKHLMVCGTFLKTLSDTTDSTYTEEKGFMPIAIGGLVLHIKPTSDWVDMWVNR